MAFSHILITRPAEESAELASMLSSQPASVLVLPAYAFRACEPFPDQLRRLADACEANSRPIVIFTSPRAVGHGLEWISGDMLRNCRVAAIGPTTERLLQAAGVEISLRGRDGYTSEDLLAAIPAAEPDAAQEPRDAFILAAPGGRAALADGLRARGYRSNLLLVYERKPAELDADTVADLAGADRVLSIWTSAESIRSLSQRLPGPVWEKLRGGEWMVISERLARVARSYHPARVHLATGPTNQDLAAAVEAIE